ncbi:MAG: hypothetical protein R3B93_27150 [Bacteroidia bacterium]
MSTPRYRYPGAQPFTKDDRVVFFGRKRDTDRLTELIRLEQLTVLYGKSGLGKSSLLNAGVLPRLSGEAPEAKDKDFPPMQVINLRLGAYSEKTENQPTPLENVLTRLSEYARPDDWTTQPGTVAPLWQVLKSIQGGNSEREILLVFDQFEELFTYPKAQVDRFAEELAQALYEEIPQPFRELREKGQIQLSSEELDELFNPLRLKIVVGIRSDRLSFLNGLRPYVSNILRRTYELKPLSRIQAEEAITYPAYHKGDYTVDPFDYSDEALDQMLDFLSNDGKSPIESTQLQIVCQVAERLVEEKKITTFTQTDTPQIQIEDIGGFTDIYRDYYLDVLNEFADPEQKQAAQKLIEEDLIFEPDERRISLYEGILHKKGLTEENLRLLVDKHHLLRAEPNMSGGYTYELSHDTLVRPILEVKKARVAEEEKAREEARRKEAEKERIAAEARAKEAEERAQREENLKKEAVRGQKRARRFSVVAFVLAGAAIIASWLAVSSSRQVRAERKTAYENLARAYEREQEESRARIERFKRDKASFERAGEVSLVREADSLIEVYTLKIDTLEIRIDSLRRGAE